MQFKTYSLTLAAAAIFTLHAWAEQQKGACNTSLNIGVTITEGNSDTMLANLSLATECEKPGTGSFRAGLEGNYGESTVESERETTIENARIFSNLKRNLSDRIYAGIDATLLYDDIAAIDYRAILSPNIGGFVVRTDRLSLHVEFGPAYVWEQVEDIKDDYFALRLAERIEYVLSETARCWQSLEYLPKARDLDNYLINAEAGIEAAVNSRVKLRIVLQEKYDSMPGTPEKNDLTLVAGAAISI